MRCVYTNIIYLLLTVCEFEWPNHIKSSLMPARAKSFIGLGTLCLFISKICIGTALNQMNSLRLIIIGSIHRHVFLKIHICLTIAFQLSTWMPVSVKLRWCLTATVSIFQYSCSFQYETFFRIFRSTATVSSKFQVQWFIQLICIIINSK